MTQNPFNQAAPKPTNTGNTVNIDLVLNQDSGEMDVGKVVVKGDQRIQPPK